MQPFTVVLGIIFGSLFSIAFSLATVLLVFWILRNDNPRFDSELPELFQAALIFVGVALLAGASFFGTLRERRWRYVVLPLLWCALLVTGWHYWPD